MAKKAAVSKTDKCVSCKKAKKNLHVTVQGYLCDDCFKAKKEAESKTKIVGKVSAEHRQSRVLIMQRTDGKQYTFYTDLTDDEIFAMDAHKGEKIIQDKSPRREKSVEKVQDSEDDI